MIRGFGGWVILSVIILTAIAGWTAYFWCQQMHADIVEMKRDIEDMKEEIIEIREYLDYESSDEDE